MSESRFNDFQSMVVLIDADNTQLSKLEGMLHEISAYGRIIVKKAYGNWKKQVLAKWEDEIKRLAIKAEQQFDYVSGKNTTDIAMVIDAMDLLHTGRYDAVVLVSSDSDFTPLAVRMREDGIYVIGVGEKKTPEAFRNACDDFIYLEYIQSSEPKKKEKSPKKSTKGKKEAVQDMTVQEKEDEISASIDEIHVLLRIANGKYQDDDGFTNVSVAGTYIKRVKPEFNTYAYGFAKLSDLLKAFPDRYEIRKEPTNGNASVIMYRCR